MAKMNFLLVYISLIAVCLHSSDGTFEDDMWDRFRLWFHVMDHNYDDILSIEDLQNCTVTHVPTSESPSRVRAKCEEFLPRWFRFFILRGQEATTENQFIQTFRDLRQKDEENFEDIIYKASKLFWIIMDMNNDRWITQDEDACVGDRTYSAFALSISFAQYLLVGRLDEDIADIFCPWIY